MANTASKSEIPEGRYCYSVAEKAVHYVSTNMWTPNNIKRLILSPDMVIVQLHTSNSVIRKIFDVQLYNECIQSPKYKNMVSVLGGAGNNVCSHVEEIIYCIKGYNGGVLHAGEADLRSIIAAEKMGASESQLIKTIGDRFKRLHSIVYYNGNAVDLMKSFGKTMYSDPYFHLGDVSDAAIKAIPIHKDDWYKGYFLRPATYPADAEGGSLYKRLHQVSDTYEDKVKKDRADAVKNDMISSAKTKASKHFNMLIDILTATQKLFVMCLQAETRSYLGTEFSKFFEANLQTLISCQAYQLHDALGLVTSNTQKQALQRSRVSYSGIPKKEVTSKEINAEFDELRSLIVVAYDKLFSFYIDFFKAMSDMYGITTYLYLSGQPRKLAVSPTKSSKYESGVVSMTCYGRELRYETAGILDSVGNMCMQISKLVVSDKYDKFTSIEYWQSIMRGDRDAK